MSENRFGAGNYDIEILPSALRTATTNSPDQENIVGARGLIWTVDVTVEDGAITLTPTLEHKDLISGKYETIFSAAANITAVGTHTYVLYPANMTAAQDVVETAELPLGRVWRAAMTSSGTTSMTYSVSGTYIL